METTIVHEAMNATTESDVITRSLNERMDSTPDYITPE